MILSQYKYSTCTTTLEVRCRYAKHAACARKVFSLHNLCSRFSNDVSSNNFLLEVASLNGPDASIQLKSFKQMFL
jgi:hypothetical protein